MSLQILTFEKDAVLFIDLGSKVPGLSEGKKQNIKKSR